MAAVLTNGFWNRRELYCSLRACSQENVCKEKVDEDDIKDTISKLNSLVFKTKLLHLWSEAAIIRRVVYKNGNQHRKQLYFQGLKRIVKSLSRLQETEIYNKMINLRNTFPRLSKNGFFAKPPSTLPSFGSVVSILGCLVGAAQLTVQIPYIRALLQRGLMYRVFLKDFMHSISQCYDVLFPWISLLENTKTEESLEAKDLPKSLKIWLLPLEGESSNKKLNSTCGTPQVRLSTSGALEKLFRSTPRGHLQDSSSRISEAIVDSLKESPDDLGESCVPDEVTKSFKHRNASTVEKDFQPKIQLFTENPEELFTAKLGPEKRGAEIIDSEVSNTPIRIKDKELERPLHRAVLWRRSYSTTRIFGNKTWKLVIEMAKRRKLAKRDRKIKGNLKGSSKGAAREKERRKMKVTNEHWKDGTVIEAKMKEAKMLRKRRHGRNIKGSMKGPSKDTSRENEGSKMKKQEKDSGKDDTGIKADTKEEHIRDGTFIEAKMKTKTVWKWRRGDKIRDGTFAEKRRIEAFSDREKGSSNRSRKRKRVERKDAVQKIARKDKNSQDERDKRGKNNQDDSEKKVKKSQDERDKRGKNNQDDREKKVKNSQDERDKRGKNNQDDREKKVKNSQDERDKRGKNNQDDREKKVKNSQDERDKRGKNNQDDREKKVKNSQDERDKRGKNNQDDREKKVKNSQDERDKRGKNNQDDREKKVKNSQDEREKKDKKKEISKGELFMEKPRNQGHVIDSKRVEETVNFETSDRATEAEGNNNKTYGGNEALRYRLKIRKRKTGKRDTNPEEQSKQNATLGWRKRRRKGTVEHADYMNDIDEIFSVLDD